MSQSWKPRLTLIDGVSSIRDWKISKTQKGDDWTVFENNDDLQQSNNFGMSFNKQSQINIQSKKSIKCATTTSLTVGLYVTLNVLKVPTYRLRDTLC